MKSSVIEKANIFNTSSLTKYRNEIFGLSAIWIVLFHIFGHIYLPSLPGMRYLARIISIGNMGVDIFLFLSALGLRYSIDKNTLKQFYINRFNRVIIPYLILALPYFFVYDFILLKDGFLQFIYNLTTLNFWLSGDHPTWYVSFIILAYALYPIIYKLHNKTHGFSTVLLIVISVIIEFILLKVDSVLYINAEKALSRVPIFLLGVLLSDVISNKKIKISLVSVILCFCVTVIMFLAITKIHIVLARYCYGIMAICLIVIYSYLRTIFDLKLVSNCLKWLGIISFEIYIIHVFISRIISFYDAWNILPVSVWYIIIIAATILLSKLLSLTVKFILNSKKLKLKGANTSI